MNKRLLATALTVIVALTIVLCMPAGAADMGKVGEYVHISCGIDQTAAIDADGVLWMWGSNVCDALGNNGIGNDKDVHGGTIQTVPAKIMDNVVSVTCGFHHTTAIKADGSLWVWGSKHYTSLGDGVTESSSVPLKIMDNVVAVSCCGESDTAYTAVIKSDGSLWTWGRNGYGQLGNGSTEDSSVPIKIMENVTAVSCGMGYTAAIKTDGSLWMWGHNAYGQLGNGGVGNCKNTMGQPIQTVPEKVMDDVAAVSCGYGHTAAIKIDGNLWMWGANSSGQLGNGGGGNKEYRKLPIQTVPVKVMEGVASASCGFNHTVACGIDGSLWTWGNNYYGELGNGSTENSSVPVKIMNSGVAAISCGFGHTIALKMDDTIWTWGSNHSGQLGNGFKEYYSPVPEEIKLKEILIAYPSTQTVDVDGKAVEFQCYALKDAAGNDTNYIKLRDLADILNGSAAQFEVGWNDQVTITTGQGYTKDGSEQNTPFSGQREYKEVNAQTLVNGEAKDLAAFTLTDDNGGGYTYYKLRDLGAALGIKVDWTAERGIFIETK